MKILKTIYMLIDLGELGQHYIADTIEYEGKFWIVPDWIDNPTEGWKKPERIICVSTLPHRKGLPSEGADFVLECPMTKAILSGQIPPPPSIEYTVVENPNVEYPSDGLTH